MAAQGLNFSRLSNVTSFTAASYKAKQKNTQGYNVNQKALPGVNKPNSSEYYRSSSLLLEFSSKDGDKISFNMESAEYRKAFMVTDIKNTKQNNDMFTSYVKGQLARMRDELIGSYSQNKSGKVHETENPDSETKLQIPEYWNSENTSQRIVDFSVSFSASFKGSDQEFFNKIKSAINDGFKMAKQMMGSFPEAVTKITDQTYNLVMEKLDSWAIERKTELSETV